MAVIDIRLLVTVFRAYHCWLCSQVPGAINVYNFVRKPAFDFGWVSQMAASTLPHELSCVHLAADMWSASSSRQVAVQQRKLVPTRVIEFRLAPDGL